MYPRYKPISIFVFWVYPKHLSYRRYLVIVSLGVDSIYNKFAALGFGYSIYELLPDEFILSFLLYSKDFLACQEPPSVLDFESFSQGRLDANASTRVTFTLGIVRHMRHLVPNRKTQHYGMC